MIGFDTIDESINLNYSKCLGGNSKSFSSQPLLSFKTSFCENAVIVNHFSVICCKKELCANCIYFYIFMIHITI